VSSPRLRCCACTAKNRWSTVTTPTERGC
jgi:hypothetical protein